MCNSLALILNLTNKLIRHVDTDGSIVPMLSIVRKTAYFYRGMTFCGARLAGTLGDVAEGYDLLAGVNLLALIIKQPIE
jgi:hypothetical protein|tara:strand:- start:977 stop:1213 length:237 start_codon:yes stop_codon:yes gene_type:complete